MPDDSILIFFHAWFQLHISIIYFRILYIIIQIQYRHHVTLCIGQLHLIIVYRVVLGCVRCSCVECYYMLFFAYFPNSLIECHFIMMIAIITGIFWHSVHFELHIKAFSNYVILVLQMRTSCLFLHLDIRFEYWIEHVTFGLLYGMFSFSISIFYVGMPGLAPDYPCGVWCRGLTICFVDVGHFLVTISKTSVQWT